MDYGTHRSPFLMLMFYNKSPFLFDKHPRETSNYKSTKTIHLFRLQHEKNDIPCYRSTDNNGRTSSDR